MSKINWFLGVLISSTMLFFACSSTNCDCSDNPGSSSVENPGSSSSVYSSSSANTVDQMLIKKNITLSNANGGYADIDETAIYTESEASGKLDKIDLVAYCGTDMGCKNNSIYSPREIDLFWNPQYIGKNIFLFKIPDEMATVFKTAKKLSDIIDTFNSLVTIMNDAKSGVNEIPIEEGKAFFVSTSEGKYRIAIIKEAGNQSVGLEIVEIPD